MNTANIAHRLRVILGFHGQEPPEQEQIDQVAHRLRVSGGGLRTSLDVDAPHPTLDVLVAVVRSFGIDPTWLVSGEYNGASHHQAIQGSNAEVESLVWGMLHRPASDQPSASKGLSGSKDPSVSKDRPSTR